MALRSSERPDRPPTPQRPPTLPARTRAFSWSSASGPAPGAYRRAAWSACSTSPSYCRIGLPWGDFLRHLVDRSVRFGAADHMVSEALYPTDPDGLGIEVYRDRPRDEWILRDGIVMGGSDPIDGAGLNGHGCRRAMDGRTGGFRCADPWGTLAHVRG